MPTALIYVRRSEVRSSKPTLSPQRQQDTCVQFCQDKGWTAELYVDAEGHKSGRSEKGRPDWLRLKDRIKYSQPGEIAAVVVYALDRSSRSTRDFLNFLHLLQDKKADFVSVTQPFLDTTSAVGRAFMSMVSVWSQLEADMDSERVIADIAYRQEAGLFFGHCPIGYTRQVIDRDKIPMPDQDAPKVVQIWEEYAAGGHSYRSLARWINDTLQLPTRGGDVWTHRHVQIMFDNWTFYTGWVTRYRKKGGIEKYRGKHPAIITDELAAQVLSVRSEKESTQLRQRRPAKYPYLITPVLYCADCGSAMRAFPSHGLPNYRHVQKGCSWSIVDAAKIEQQVLDRFRAWEVPEGVEADLEAELREYKAQHQVSSDDQQKLTVLERRKEKAKRLFELGMRDEAWLVSTVAEIDAAITGLRPNVTLPYVPGQLIATMRSLIVAITDPASKPETVKALVVKIIERIETNGETITSLQPRRWFAQFFRDCDSLYPQGNLGPYLLPFVRGVQVMFGTK